MKKILIATMLMLASTLSMAQLSPSAEGIRQKVAEYARSQGMKVNFANDALTLQRDTLDYLIGFGGTNPVYVELRLADLNISACNPACIAKAANHINLNRSAIKAAITPDLQILRLTSESFVNDAQSVTNTLNKLLTYLANAWKYCHQKYDEFVDNQNFSNLHIPFEVYTADVVNVDQNDNLLTEPNTDIKSADTQYISTQLSMIVHEEGDYEIGVQFITPDGKVSKAEDDGTLYSYTTTLHLTQQQSIYIPDGWGSTNSGTWGPGNYQFVFFYKDKPIYVKKFTIH